MGFLDKMAADKLAKEKDKQGKASKKRLDKAVEEGKVTEVDSVAEAELKAGKRKAPPARPVAVYDMEGMAPDAATRFALFERETAGVLGRLPQEQGFFSKLMGKKDTKEKKEGTKAPGRRVSYLDKMLKKGPAPINVGTVDRKEVKNYRVYFKTSDKLGAGTESHVFCILVGSKYRTEPIIFNGLVDVQEMRSKGGDDQMVQTHLDKPFQRDQIDQFKIKCKDLGDLQQIYIGEDDTSASLATGGSSWHVDRVFVDDLKGTTTHFPLNDWIQQDKEKTMAVPGKLVEKGDAPVEKDVFKIYLTDTERSSLIESLQKDMEKMGNAMALNALL